MTRLRRVPFEGWLLVPSMLVMVVALNFGWQTLVEHRGSGDRRYTLDGFHGIWPLSAVAAVVVTLAYLALAAGGAGRWAIAVWYAGSLSVPGLGWAAYLDAYHKVPSDPSTSLVTGKSGGGVGIALSLLATGMFALTSYAIVRERFKAANSATSGENAGSAT